MTACVLLLRGINVGGAGKLPMADLRALLARLGADRVATHIQSGNAVFLHERPGAALPAAIRDAIEAGHGFRPAAFLLSGAEFSAVLAANPFPEAESDPRPMHLYFHDNSARPDRAALDALLAPGEQWHCTDRVLYLRAPDGIGRSAFAAKLPRHFKAVMTARNLRTCRKLAEMAGALSR
ncbi:DUF1697 domain-containing protein [Frigidibacter sp. ROC022]|uniref:DUF1697 domain-containing protein n=1 Tax=Frigidibacter sp. ROC022 TaxID=2971796 RepID=UPI00215B33EF|nr:DUF1697 domain-containing protein [Frigidibacter sp. ROC022]